MALRFTPDDEPLHALRWETLHDPERGGFLLTNERVLFGRSLDSPHMDPVVAKRTGALRAVVAAANPSSLPTFRLKPVDVIGEVQRSRAALGSLPTTVLARELGEPAASLANITAALRDGPDILYLVCHGTNRQGVPYLWLEGDNGSLERIAGADFAQRLAYLPHRPLLVVLASCQSAGESHEEGVLAAVGPQLVATVGIPAVLAMQGNVSMETVANFMPTLFRELQRDGLIDRAVAAARSVVFDHHDWWTPVLFLRLRDEPLFTASALPKPLCPYPGMESFSAENARFFHGRKADITQLLHRLRGQRRLLVIGPSGCGKSSLVQAGLLPQLATSSFFPPAFWLVRSIRLGSQPLAALTKELMGDPSEQATVTALLAAHAPAQQLLLVIDQFEELFTMVGRDEQRRVVATLQTLQEVRDCTLLLVLRADFYPDLMATPDLWALFADQRFDVVPLKGKALRTAIERPADEVGVELEPELVERLLADSEGEPGVLPLVQETMALLWEQMEGRKLTLDAYQQLGEDSRSGLAVAIARRAETTLTKFSEAQRIIARRILLRLIQFGEGRAHTRRQQPIVALRAEGDDLTQFAVVLGTLAEGRLLTLSWEAEGDERRVDIAHEALITGWPTLQDWLSQQRESEQTRRRLEAKVHEWVRLGSSSSGLLDDVELLEAERWLSSDDAILLGYDEQLLALVKTSSVAQRQRAEDQERGRTQLLRLVAGLIVALALVLVVAIYARTQQQQAQDNFQLANNQAATAIAAQNIADERRMEADDARATAVAEGNRAEAARGDSERNAIKLRIRALSSGSEAALRRGDIDDALALAMTACNAEPCEPEAELALAQAAYAPGTRRRFEGHAGRVTSVAFSPDGRTALSGSEDKTLRLWDVASGRELQRLEGHTGTVWDVAFSPDGQRVLSGSFDGTVRGWDVENGQELRRSEGQGDVSSVAFSAP